MDYYFQLNTKHGISLQRAQYLFNGLSRRTPYWLDRYVKNICGMRDDEILEMKWHFLYHVAEILTRKDFWEVYTELEAQHLQSTYEVCKTLHRDDTDPVYNCGRYIPANGINFDGSPSDFPFTPFEIRD